MPSDRDAPLQGRGYRAEIDGLRGFAVIAVLLYHLGMKGAGFVGVDIFFVISGYLITGIVVDRLHTQGFSFPDFFARRIKRIFPALFLVLFVFSVLAFFFLVPADYRVFFRTAAFAGLQVPNVFFSSKVDYFADQADNPLLHTWSLGVEAQFYIVWPVLLFLVYRYARTQRAFLFLVSFIVLSSFAAAELLIRAGESGMAFYLLHARAWELALGGLVATGGKGFLPRVNRHVFSLIGLGMMVGAVVYTPVGHFPGWGAVLPCLGAALYIHAAQNGMGIGHKILNFSAMTWVGRLSYALYLWHWPVIVFYTSYTGVEPDIFAAVILAAVSLGLSWLSYTYVETPLRRAKTPAGKTLWIALLVVLVFTAAFVTMRRFEYADIRFTGRIERSWASFSPIQRKCNIESGNLDGICTVGDVTGSRHAVLIGDSHAAHYAELLDAWGRGNDTAVTVVLQNGCPVWYRGRAVMKNAQSCKDFDTQPVEDYLDKMHKTKGIDYVFLAMRSDILFEDNNDARHAENVRQYFLDSYSSFLKMEVGEVIVMAQVPLFNESPLDCYARSLLPVSRFLKPEKSGWACFVFDDAYVSGGAYRRAMDVLRGSAAEAGVRFLDLAAALPAGAAVDETGKITPFYKDRDHLNPVGSLSLLPAFTQRMQPENP